MGYIEITKLNPMNPDHRLDLCDQCGQQGVVKSGHMTYDSHGEPLIFICFNCKQKTLK